jgi:hypothetical protein
MKKTLKQIYLIALIQSIFIFNLAICIVQFVKKVYWQPLVTCSEYVQEQIEKEGGSFATMGLNSPTVSSSFTLNYVKQYSKQNDEAFVSKNKYILLPKWLENKCTEYNYNVIKRDYYLTVCQLKEEG